MKEVILEVVKEYPLALEDGEVGTTDRQPQIGNNGTVYYPMHRVNTTAATPSSVTIEKMKFNITRKYDRLHHLPEFKQVKDEPIALIGGGPSLKETKEKIKFFKNTMVAGSAHDYLVTNGIIPKYAVICDPDAISANYLKHPHKDIIYLISTGCDNAVYDALEGHNIKMWHCYSDDYLNQEAMIEPNFQAVGGGCTVGLRSISIAIMLGYSDIHFFGYDSCLGVGKEHHAYSFTDASEEVGQIYEIKLGLYKKLKDEKIFYCAGYQLAQCDHFKEFYINHHKYFEPTFHGEGLLTELIDMINEEKFRLAREQGLDITQEEIKIRNRQNLNGLLFQKGNVT